MKFTEDFGIPINQEVEELLQKAISHAGNRRQLALQLKIGTTTISNWLGASDRKGQYITWDQWKPLRNYLAAHRALDAADPRWMLPSELRDALQNGDAVRSDDEARLLDLFRALTPDGQQTAIRLIHTLIPSMGKGQSSGASSSSAG